MQRLIEKIKTEIGEPQDMCSISNRILHDMLSRIDREDSLARIKGHVEIDGETFDHEWCEFEGNFIDITSDQFAGEIEYHGESTDWQKFSDVEEKEISGHVDAIWNELAGERLDSFLPR